MKRTKKYLAALEIATINHSNQEQLYKELNRLGFFWNAVQGKWERDDRLPEPPSETLKIRLWVSNEEIDEFSEVVTQLLRQNGYVLVDKSEAYLCRPPKQNESRVYLTFRRE